MGDYADDAVDRDLNSMFDYDEYEEMESGNGDTWFGIFRAPRRRRRKPTNQDIFENYADYKVDNPVDPSQF